jgi:hypothetical protein
MVASDCNPAVIETITQNVEKLKRFQVYEQTFEFERSDTLEKYVTLVTPGLYCVTTHMDILPLVTFLHESAISLWAVGAYKDSDPLTAVFTNPEDTFLFKILGGGIK